MAYQNPGYNNGEPPALSADNVNALANAVELLTVPNGGTGAASLPSGAILKGNGSNPISGLNGTGALYATSSGSPRFGVLPASCGGTGASSLDTFYSNILSQILVKSSSAPTGSASKLWINTTNNTLHYWNGSAWIAIRGVFA